MSLRFTFLIPTLLCLTAFAQAPCPAGQSRGPDTQGQCCWPQQAWSSARRVCVGIPECPKGMRAENQGCVADCPAGQAIGPETQGHCCWPGQVWSSGRALCIGIPQCPAGSQPQGEACVSAGAAAPPPAAVSAPVAGPPPPPPAGPPPSGSGPAPGEPPPAPAAVPVEAAPPRAVVTPPPPEAAPEPGVQPGFHKEKHFRTSLIIGGAATLGAGYVIALGVTIGGAIYSASVPANQCWAQAANVGWIPFVGPMWAIGNQYGHVAENNKPCQDIPLVFAPGVAIAVVDTVLQFAGAAMMAVGFAWRQEVTVPDEVGAALGLHPELVLRPFAPGAPLGVTLALEGL